MCWVSAVVFNTIFTLHIRNIYALYIWSNLLRFSRLIASAIFKMIKRFIKKLNKNTTKTELISVYVFM